MKTRIKYAFDRGIPVGFLVFIVLGLFQLGKNSFSDVFFSLESFKRLGLYLLGGVLGYFFLGWWADKDKRNREI